MPDILTYVYWGVSSACVVLASLTLLHMLQLESYYARMYVNWVLKHLGMEFIPYLFVGLIPLMLRLCWAFFYGKNPLLAGITYTAADIVYLFLLLVMYFSYKKRTAKKPLVFTGRIKRLIAVLFLLAFVFCAQLFVRVSMELSWREFFLANVVRYAPGMFLPVFVLLGFIATYPFEFFLQRWYYNDARKKLGSRKALVKIGITGSYGKTSTKYALGTMLSQKHSVLITPGSVNTPMGVTRIIRENLADTHEVFIAEMGARHKGDIKELCQLVQPMVGIITAVGKQHLETFGSVETIIETKSELMHALPEDGICFFNADYAYCRQMYDACALKEKYLFGTEGDDLFMRAHDVAVSGEGSTFTLTAHDGNSVACTTTLLGRPCIWNILGAAACAYKLGVRMDDIAEGIEKLEPVEHRLQLIKGPITVIDDAFNSNPVGSKEALMVLQSFDTKRIIVTPGMVELGEEEAELNRAFGRAMAQSTDIAILVGKSRIEPIREGLIEAGFDAASIVCVQTLAEATAVLPSYTEPGCVVLFENDLTDNYDE